MDRQVIQTRYIEGGKVIKGGRREGGMQVDSQAGKQTGRQAGRWAVSEEISVRKHDIGQTG